MRAVIVPALLVFSSLSASPHKDRIEHARTMTVGFKTGEAAIFTLSDAKIAGVTLRVGSVDYTVPPGECAKLRDVRFETVSLCWNGSFESAAKSDYFSLQFDMGKENARAFGEMPLVQLMFRDGKFADATITKKTAEDTSTESEV